MHLSLNDSTHPVLPDHLNDVLSIPYENVRDSCANGQVSSDLPEQVRPCEPRQANGFQLGWVQAEVVVQYLQLVVQGTIEVEKGLREEREVLGVPCVGRIRRAERDAVNKTFSSALTSQ